MEPGCPHGMSHIAGDRCLACERERLAAEEAEQKVRELLDRIMLEIVTYPHHGMMVKVRKVLKGKHRDHSLCYICAKFKPNSLENCVTAQDTFENCVRHNVITPMWECPDFKETV